MIIVIGHLNVDPATRDAYVAECAQAVELARAAPGCLHFSIGADLLEPDRVDVAERWATREDLDAFRGSGPPDDQMTAIRSFSVTEHEVPDEGVRDLGPAADGPG